MEGLDYLVNLQDLYLENNSIRKIEGLIPLKFLKTLYISKNRLETYDNCVGLLECPSIMSLDISNCDLEHDKKFIEIFEKMPNLGNLIIKNNEFSHKFR